MAPVEVGDLVIDCAARVVTLRGRQVGLTPLEFRLVRELATHRDRAVCVDDLLRTVWGCSLSAGGTRAQVASCIKRLRRKVEPDPGNPRYLQSVRGWGYRLSSL
ncbi:MAG: winged helix-turn-helix domain-containing protein [Chloroflexota bacterium]